MRKINFICLDCGRIFKAEQGSRRRFCDKCLLRHVLEKKGLDIPAIKERGQKES